MPAPPTARWQRWCPRPNGKCRSSFVTFPHVDDYADGLVRLVHPDVTDAIAAGIGAKWPGLYNQTRGEPQQGQCNRRRRGLNVKYPSAHRFGAVYPRDYHAEQKERLDL